MYEASNKLMKSKFEERQFLYGEMLYKSLHHIANIRDTLGYRIYGFDETTVKILDKVILECPEELMLRLRSGIQIIYALCFAKLFIYGTGTYFSKGPVWLYKEEDTLVLNAWANFLFKQMVEYHKEGSLYSFYKEYSEQHESKDMLSQNNIIQFLLNNKMSKGSFPNNYKNSNDTLLYARQLEM